MSSKSGAAGKILFFESEKRHGIRPLKTDMLTVCAFIIGQYHSGNYMSSKSGAAGEILISESEKCHGIRPLKTDMLTVSAFDAFIHIHDESKHYLSHRFAQRLSLIHI